MDTSETYIKQVDCSEIQRQRKELNDWGDCDLYVFKRDLTQILNTSSDYHYPSLDFSDRYFKTKVGVIWLPRQDDLQAMYLREMLAGTYNKIPTLLEEFYAHFEEYGYPAYAISREQLELAFVMQRLYNKVWMDDKWDVVK